MRFDLPGDRSFMEGLVLTEVMAAWLPGKVSGNALPAALWYQIGCGIFSTSIEGNGLIQ